MFDFLELAPAPDALLSEARDQGVHLFGAGGFARAVAAALGTLGVRVRAFVVTSPATADIDGVPVIALGALAANVRHLPVWIAVYNRNAASDLGAIVADCQAQGCSRLLLPPGLLRVTGRPAWLALLAHRSPGLCRRASRHRGDLCAARG